MSSYDAGIDAYIEQSADFARPVLEHLRELIHTTCPDVEETWKWNFPHFMYEGAILCSMAAFKAHCAFGFWKASLMQDTDNVLEIKDREAMGHLGKITSLKDLPKDSILKKYIKAAMKLNEEGVKLAPKKQAVAQKEIEVPAEFAKELKKNKKAEQAFNDFAYSHRREYVMWINEAKTEPTRVKRMAQAIEWLAEGKRRHWKYEQC
jgi:uncharacterized protein YdeI (YjbR/CyaY-like superfamily)